jgi:hypothetical protein
MELVLSVAMEGWSERRSATHRMSYGGRHQVATLLSLSPLTTLTASILSVHHESHDSQSRAVSTWNACPSGPRSQALALYLHSR